MYVYHVLVLFLNIKPNFLKNFELYIFVSFLNIYGMPLNQSIYYKL